jgi:hypothetical protein
MMPTSSLPVAAVVAAPPDLVVVVVLVPQLESEIRVNSIVRMRSKATVLLEIFIFLFLLVVCFRLADRTSDLSLT